MSRRRFLTTSTGIAAAATAGGLLSGCAGSVSSGGSGGKTTLTIMASGTELGTPAEIKAAEKALGMKLKMVKYDLTRLTAMLTSGNAPDLVRAEGSDAPYLASHSVAQDLDDRFAKSTVLKVGDLDPVNDIWRWDGKQQGSGPRYGMAKDWSQSYMLWYNTALFDKADEPYPSDTQPLTYDKLLDVGKRLTQSGKKSKVYGLGMAGNFETFMILTTEAGGQLFNEDYSAVDFTTSEARSALSWYLELAKSGAAPTIANPDPNGWDWPTFDAGRMAISTSGYWFGGMVVTDKKIAATARLAPAPQFGSKRISTGYTGTGLWMPKAGKNKDAAWEAMEYFLGGAPAKKRAESGAGLPALKSLRSLLPKSEGFQKQAYAVQEKELSYFEVLPFTPYVRKDAVDAVINQVMPAAIKGSVPVSKLADQLNEGINKQLANGKKLIK
ncbi:extracellular solute-binding protein [Streptomyces prunicolor]|uniref:extracellular solute-binding protein n=1 Tax=Streptomyces prunicolor TaxID=67348 RepID=UPI0003804169|nr:extracellular solute-binding protein [Streptomyces prunicolor]